MTSIEDTTIRAMLLHWLEIVVVSERGFGKAPGVLKLGVGERPGAISSTDIREWVAFPGKSDVHELADEIVREAELHCEGRGGGTSFFIVRAYRDGVEGTNAFAHRPFQITMEPSNALALEEISERGVRSDLFAQNRELHQNLIKMHTASAGAMAELRRTIESQGKAMQSLLEMSGDNIAMARINAEQRRTEEAEAFATASRSKRMDTLLATVMQMGGPLLVKAVEKVMQEEEPHQTEAAPQLSDGNPQVTELLGMVGELVRSLPPPEKLQELVELLPRMQEIADRGDRSSGIHLLPAKKAQGDKE